MQSIAKQEDVPIPRPFGATGNDAQKIHASEIIRRMNFSMQKGGKTYGE